MMNCTSKQVVLVPGCLLCPIYQVGYDEKKLGWRSELLDFLHETGVSIIQMPCPEVQFENYDSGLSRKPHGIRYYENLSGFHQHCRKTAHEVAHQVVALKNHGYVIKAILGIENSPTCAVNRIFTYGIGTESRSGLFISELKNYLDEHEMMVAFIGITRHNKNQKKVIAQLKKIIETC